MYVLIFVAGMAWFNPPVFFMQEFTSYDTCLNALRTLNKARVVVAECVPK